MNVSTDRIERDLRTLLRGDIEFDLVSRRLYATDAGMNEIEPLGVVCPRDAEDVARLVSYAAERGLSLVPRGTGSGLAGGAVGAGIQVDFTRHMDSILEVATDGTWARVQPGVVLASLNRHLRDYGTFFAPDPSSENYCSLGGMIGTNSSGARTVAYGGTKDHVLALEVVLADGSTFSARPHAEGSAELDALLASTTAAGRAFAVIVPTLKEKQGVIATGMPRVVKNCAGYRVEAILGDAPLPGQPRSLGGTTERDAATVVNLQNLFVGAEGTLGLVTEATLNLVPLPAVRGIAMAYFPSVFASGEAVPDILALSPSALEIMDSRFLALVRRHDSRVDAMLPDRTDTALLIELEGEDREELDERFADLRRSLEGTALLDLVRAQTEAQTNQLWTVRKSAVALAQRMPGPRRALPFIEDVTVHPTEVPKYVDFLQGLFDRERVDAIMYGHLGDGNIHTRPLLDPKETDDLQTMQRLYDEVSAYVMAVRGTMSGEHGDGLVRTPYIRQTYGDEIYALFESIKGALDPQGLMNPGKKIMPRVEEGADLRRNLRFGADYRTVPQEPILHFSDGEYESEIEKCHGCAQCKSVVATTMCPTYKATRKEHASPRAKANLLRSIITGALDPESAYGEAAVKAVTDYCLVCGMCAVECPSGVNIPKLMLEAKSKYREIRPGALSDMILGRAEKVSQLGSMAAPVANPLLRQPLLRRLAEPVVGIHRQRPFPPFARPRFNAATHAGAAIPAGAGSLTVAYFCDLFAEYNNPRLAHTVLRLLAAHGAQALLPEQRAGGIPEMLYGYWEGAREAAEANVRAFLPLVSAGALLVSAEPTATFAFKVHYPDYSPGPETSLVANAVRDLGEFLVRLRADRPEAVPPAQALPPYFRRVAYHQPCHLKAQQIGSPSLELLREIPGLEVVDLAAGCCGMAGTFGMKTGTYDLSMLAGGPLFHRIAEAAPDLVLSECSTCRMQIAHATGLTTAHPVTVLARAYGA